MNTKHTTAVTITMANAVDSCTFMKDRYVLGESVRISNTEWQPSNH